MSFALALLVTLAGCGSGGSHKSALGAKSSQSGGDAAASGGAESNGSGANGVGGSKRAAASTTKTTLNPIGEGPGLHCGLPTGTLPDGATSPSTAFPPPQNDFPLVVEVKPARGDPGTKVHVHIIAGRPKTLIVLVAKWFDGKDHGVRPALFTNEAGLADVDFTVPKEAPAGLSRIVTSATFYVSEQHNESAIKRTDFVVTGPGCP